MNNLGRAIKIFRTVLNIKQCDLADKLDVSTNYLYLVEQGKRDPSISFLKKTSKVLGVPISFLFLEEEVDPKLSMHSKEIYERLKSLIIDLQRLAHREGKEA